MDTLPEEMLLEIMEYLKYSDLKCFRLVCKKFYEVSLAFRIVNRDNFAYGDLFFTRYKFDNFMKILSTTERNFYHFHFVNTKITASFREFVEKRAEDILSLKFERCEIILDTISFCEIINECIKLKSLTLRRLYRLRSLSPPPLVCNRAATISLPALETMHISCIPDDMFNVLMDTNVKNLHLCVYWHHLNDTIYTRDRLEDLKCLDLSDMCTDEELMYIADKLNLTTIHIDCFGVTDRGFKYFVEKQRRLQSVHIRDSTFVTDEILVAIAENLKDLKDLTISVASNDIEYSFDALNRIINLTPVRRLYFYGSADISGLVTTVGDVTMSKCLRQLYICDVQNETNVTYIAENFLSLTELTFVDSNGVTNETLRLICRNLKNLKILVLADCKAINAFENDASQLTFSANYNSMFSQLLDLEELDLSRSGWLSDSILETCFKLSSLRILNLEFCKGLTAKSFVAMPKNFPCLEDLNIGGLRVDKDILLSTVPLMKRLCKLRIRVSEPITEHVLKSLYEHSDSLHRVNIGIYSVNAWFIRSWERKTFVDVAIHFMCSNFLLIF